MWFLSISATFLVLTTAVRAQDIDAALPPTTQHTQWGRSSARNNAVDDDKLAAKLPLTWKVGDFDFDTGAWKRDKSSNIKWVARLGSNAFGNPVAAQGKLFVGTNNDGQYLSRFPKDKFDLGVVLCFDQRDGQFLWQYSAAKLDSGDKHDFAATGICSSPLVIGDRLWFVNNRCEVICLDAEGFRDGENDGPIKDEENQSKDEADVVWRYDMMKELGASPTFMANCSVTSLGKWLLVSTGNGSDEFGKSVPNPNAPSFIILDRETGNIRWKDDTTGSNILHGQWSSPAVHTRPQHDTVIFTPGDGWLHGISGGWPKLQVGDGSSSEDIHFHRWRFDCNDKASVWKQAGRGNRNTIIATPVVHDDLLYIATGQSPELGEGPATIWCIDLAKAQEHLGDVSEAQVFNPKHEEGQSPIPQERIQAASKERGDIIKPNTKSALKWKYTGHDFNKNGKLDPDELMHRTISTVAVSNGLVIAPDFSGIVHCLDATTGKPYWSHDMLAGCWCSPLIVGNRVYLGNDNGEVVVFALAKEKKILAINDMKETVYGTPIAAGTTMYLSTKSRLFAIELLENTGAVAK